MGSNGVESHDQPWERQVGSEREHTYLSEEPRSFRCSEKQSHFRWRESLEGKQKPRVNKKESIWENPNDTVCVFMYVYE